jgi:hypothetical protein
MRFRQKLSHAEAVWVQELMFVLIASMYYSKICNYVHHYALIAEALGKRKRGNDLVLQRYQR